MTNADMPSTLPGEHPFQPRSFAEFYPFYLGEHRDRTCRRLHFAGCVAGLLWTAFCLAMGSPWWIPLALFPGYALAWLGHFVFEKNRPATFRFPLYSFAGDWVMFKDMLTGRIPL